MSTESQGGGSNGGSTPVVGSGAIAEFAKQQWKKGEVLSFVRIEVVDGGAHVYGVKAMFQDGRRQAIADAKFVYSGCDHAFGHVVVMAGSPAS